MDKSLHIVIGMTIAYAASLLGLIVAWISYRRRRKEDSGEGSVNGGNSDGAGNDS